MTVEAISALGGTELTIKKFNDIIHPKPEDDRTGDEIAAEIIKRAGIEAIEDNEPI